MGRFQLFACSLVLGVAACGGGGDGGGGGSAGGSGATPPAPQTPAGYSGATPGAPPPRLRKRRWFIQAQRRLPLSVRITRAPLQPTSSEPPAPLLADR